MQSKNLLLNLIYFVENISTLKVTFVLPCLMITFGLMLVACISVQPAKKKKKKDRWKLSLTTPYTGGKVAAMLTRIQSQMLLVLRINLNLTLLWSVRPRKKFSTGRTYFEN